MFLYANDQERAAALETGRISTILEVPDQAELHRDLKQVETALQASGELEVADGLSHNGTARGLDGARGRLLWTVPMATIRRTDRPSIVSCCRSDSCGRIFWSKPTAATTKVPTHN